MRCVDEIVAYAPTQNERNCAAYCKIAISLIEPSPDVSMRESKTLTPSACAHRMSAPSPPALHFGSTRRRFCASKFVALS